MITYLTINYSDIYPGEKPTVTELLAGISSKIIVVVMAMINAELSDEKDTEEVQKRLTLWVVNQFPRHEAEFVFRKLKAFESRTNSPVALWGKRYALQMMKNEFLNYRDFAKTTNTPEESVRIFKAYLLTAEELNEKDSEELKAITGGEVVENDPYFFEKLVWPFLLKQFDTNNRVNPVSQMFKLFALIKYSISHPELLQSWKTFISMNGFETLRSYLGSVNFLVGIAQIRNPEKDLRVFSWINADHTAPHLHNLAFDRNEFVANPAKQVDFLGIRERPLLQTDTKEFVALDLDFLTNKAYNGPLFDMYSQTDMANTTSFKTFPDFKGHIATEVSEKIVFKGILTKLFQKKYVQLHFDDEGKDNYPDCYIRIGKKVFLIEFKDYLFPGKLVDQYSFEEIKKHIDLKFVKNQNGKNKGISQIIEHLKILSKGGFEFDKFNGTKIEIYPIIVHTNFTYQMPGINYYLNKQFGDLVQQNANLKNLSIEPLVLFDLDSLFEFLQIEHMDLKMLEGFITRYHHILENRLKRFQQRASQDNFVRARASFDEIFSTIMESELKYLPVPRRVDVFLSSIGMTNETLDAF